MKKSLQFVILLTLIIPSFIVKAQGEEKNIVSRRHYEKKEKVYTEWYNKITFNFFQGAGNITSVTKPIPPSVPCKDFSLKYGKDTSSLFVLNLSYERLKKNDMLYYGPGIAVNIGGNGDAEALYSASAYLRGRYELNLLNTFLGYDVSGLHPYASAAIGLSFFSGDKVLPSHYYRLHSWGTELEGIYYIYYQRVKTGIRFYLDYSLGFAIDCGKHKSLVIGYQAMLYPSVKRTLDLTQYANEIDNLIQTGGNKEIPMQTKEVMRLYHGVELSFRF